MNTYFISQNTLYSYSGYEKISTFSHTCVVTPLYPKLIYCANCDLSESEDGKYLIPEWLGAPQSYHIRKEYLLKNTYDFDNDEEAILYFTLKYNIIKEDSLEWLI